MAKRKIIAIDEGRCNGCGLCIPNCPEGALQIIDGKARLVSDLFCDGLGACIGHCPEGAIRIEEREAGKYDERKVMEHIVPQGPNVIKAHLAHLKGHGETALFEEAVGYLKEKKIALPVDAHGAPGAAHAHGTGGCPGSKMMSFAGDGGGKRPQPGPAAGSQLGNWPVQITLVPPNAPYFKGADLLVAADCVPFAYAGFHDDLLAGKVLLVGCPKLDDAAFYREKLTGILRQNDVRSVTCVHMEVPCCFGLVTIVKEAIAASGKDVPYAEVTIGIKGEKK